MDPREHRTEKEKRKQKIPDLVGQKLNLKFTRIIICGIMHLLLQYLQYVRARVRVRVRVCVWFPSQMGIGDGWSVLTSTS